MKTVICTIVKDEHAYIKEWIDYHQSLGFDDVYVFEDEGSLSHKTLLSGKSNVYLYGYDYNDTVKKAMGSDRKNRQHELFNWFLNRFRSKYDWIAFIDVDEFIVFESGWDLPKFCEEYKDYPGVHLAWKMFGASGHIKKPSGKVFESYTYSYNQIFPDCRWRVKSIVNTKLAKYMMSNHHVKQGVNIDKVRSIDNVKFKVAWINHYFTRSWQEWCDKIFMRGDINPGNRVLFDFFQCNPDLLPKKEELFKYALDNYNPKYIVNVSRYDKTISFPAGNLNLISKLNAAANKKTS